MAADGTVHKHDGNHVLRFERRIDHPVEKVWAAIATPAGVRGWLGKAQLDLEEGGRVWLRFDKTVGNEIEGRVTAVDPPRVLEYTFGQADSVLRWELTPDGEAATALVLTHTLPTPDQAASALAGWHTLLDMIPAALDGDDPQRSRDRWDEVEREYAAAIG
jgi:uncharacterized protein YndB with AHSA1/START domain